MTLLCRFPILILVAISVFAPPVVIGASQDPIKEDTSNQLQSSKNSQAKKWGKVNKCLSTDNFIDKKFRHIYKV